MSNEKELNLSQKLLKVQNTVKVPKNLYNSFGKYNYRNAETILEAVKPVNEENGLLLTLTDEPVMIGDWHYIKATATITDGKETASVTAYARESQTKKGMDDSQVTGTASSYARKYALNGLYLIDDTKDADTDEYRQQQGGQQKQGGQNPGMSKFGQDRPASEKQMGLLHYKTESLAKKYEMQTADLKAKLGIQKGMSEKQFKTVLKRVQDGLDNPVQKKKKSEMEQLNKNLDDVFPDKNSEDTGR